MNLPSHLLWTYAFEKLLIPGLINDNPKILASSLFFSALPDILESAPLLFYLTIKRKKLRLTSAKSIINYALDINHNQPEKCANQFPWAIKLSFYTHSFIPFSLISVGLYFFSPQLFLPFIIGYGLHLLVDIFLHNDYFSIRPLYPLKNFSLPGILTWYKVKNFSIYNYALLFIVYLLILIRNF